MARRKDSPQKAAMREMMRDYLKNNDISIKDGTDVNSNKIEKSKEISYRKDRGGKYLHKLSPVRIINRGRNDNGKWCYIFPAIDIFPAERPFQVLCKR